MTRPNRGRLSCAHATAPGGGTFQVGAGGGAVALMVELPSGYPTLPESAPSSSYRFGNKVRVWSKTEDLAALRQVVANARGDPSEVVFTDCVSTHCASAEPLRWRPRGKFGRGSFRKKVDGYPQSPPRHTPVITQRTRVYYLVNEKRLERWVDSQAKVLYGAEQRSISATSELGCVHGSLPLGV